MRKGVVGLASFFVLSVFAPFAVTAGATDEVYVPAPLEPWKAWVLNGYENRACPFLTSQSHNAQPQYICAWPGTLDLTADLHGASFSIRWRVEAPSWVPLPGEDDAWPEQVTANGQRIPVVAHGSGPSVWLVPGSFDIRGHIAWDERPQQLNVPDTVGLLRLVVDGQTITIPEREGESVTLGRGAGARESESVNLQVFRKLTDGVPAMLETRIVLDVSGPDREASFGPVLPPDFVPVDLSGDLAARLDADGKLRVQLQSGEWDLKFTARATGPLKSVAWDPPAKPWPAQEVWSYESTPRLRVTSPKGAPAIDPVQASVPDDWTSLPAFVMSKGTPLSIEESSRGLADADRNRLTLRRLAWRDFSGGAYYFKDAVTGTMKQGWRLDVAQPYVMEHAAEHMEGDLKPLLVTAGEKPDETGAEVRNPKVEVDAGVRLRPDGLAIPVTGWRETFDEVRTQLDLPVGYLLLAAPGADTSVGSWISYWTLLDVFVVAVIVALAFRLFGRQGGVFTLLFLILAYPEPGVPVWSLGALCVFGLLRKVLPVGRLQQAVTWFGRGAFAVFILAALPFVANQVRYAIYPQLQPETEWGIHNVSFAAKLARGSIPGAAQEIYPAAAMQMAPPPTLKRTDVETAQPVSVPESNTQASMAQLGKIEVTGTRITTSDIMQRYAENTIVQAGEGEPAWEPASEYMLDWTGPVTPDQTVRLLILPPWATRLLRLIVVLLLAGLAAVLARRTLEGAGMDKLGLAKWARRAAAVAMLLLLPGLLTPHPAYADTAYPPESLLNDLRTRLTAPPRCGDDCAAIAEADLRASGSDVDVLLEVHALDRVAVPVPGPNDFLVLREVRLDGVAVDGVVFRDKGTLVTVPRGVHALLLRFSASSAGKIPLSFPLRPARIDFVGDGWQVEGITRHRLQTDAVNLVRLKSASQATVSAAAQQFPPYVILRRAIELNLDWEVINQVTRVAPTEGGFSVNLPLLSDEHVITKNLTVKNGIITVPMPNEYGADWHSRLDRSASFTLVAPPMTDHAEEWVITVSPMWHAEFSGMPGVLPQHFDDDDFWKYEFHPLPGEKLTVTVTRPATMPGPTLAIDAVKLITRAGEHAGEHDLTLQVRSTQAGDHVITLPADADLMSASKDGKPLNVPLRDGKLALPITNDDRQVFQVSWRDTQGIGVHARIPDVDVGGPAANVDLTLATPKDRWVLFTYGPRLGPAVLYWGELLVVILVAWGLSHVPGTPLKFRHWMLLGLGFSTFSWKALLIVVSWLLAMKWRAENRPESRASFKLVQIGLAGLTAIALISLVSSIPLGLLGSPDMHITGGAAGSGGLHWFQDRSDSILPHAGVLTLPLWCYKLAMLAWALWLAFALVEWLRWAFSAWTRGGYWPEPLSPTPAEEDRKQ